MNLDIQLAQLEAADLVRHAVDAEFTFQFRHTLTQETVYESLLRARRREIHAHVARAYEAVYPDRLPKPLRSILRQSRSRNARLCLVLRLCPIFISNLGACMSLVAITTPRCGTMRRWHPWRSNVAIGTWNSAHCWHAQLFTPYQVFNSTPKRHR